MKAWLSTFSAVLLAVVIGGGVIYGWSRRVAQWEAEAGGQAATLMMHRERLAEYLDRLPETAGSLDNAIGAFSTAQVAATEWLLRKRPTGADARPLREALSAYRSKVEVAREELKLPGNAFAAKAGEGGTP